MPKQKPQQPHTQITAGLRVRQAGEYGSPRCLQQVFREIFLAELMDKDTGWVLKGSTNPDGDACEL